jgi:hypothetical protein
MSEDYFRTNTLTVTVKKDITHFLKKWVCFDRTTVALFIQAIELVNAPHCDVHRNAVRFLLQGIGFFPHLLT